MRALAVTSAARQPAFPDLPTMAEAGVPDFVVTSFFGIVAPAGMPAPIVDRLNKEIVAALKTPTIATALDQLGSVGSTETPEQFQASIVSALKLWKGIADTAHIKID
jgi:tripartite-type tricarboxylate transporter receptor subunit TctC